MARDRIANRGGRAAAAVRLLVSWCLSLRILRYHLPYLSSVSPAESFRISLFLSSISRAEAFSLQ